jgi:RNA polymerase sigma factor (sigma-70 family)
MDERNIQRVLEGDINAFRFIVSKYKDMSFSISMSIVKSELLAEEAVQDAFVKAFQNLKSFRGDSGFSTWLYRIVVNESLRKIKRKKLEISEIEKYSDDSNFTTDESFNYLHEAEQKEIINHVMQEMPATESLLLRLFYLEENSVESISEITQLSSSNVKVTLFRARKRFYAHLEKSYKHEMRSIL